MGDWATANGDLKNMAARSSAAGHDDLATASTGHAFLDARTRKWNARSTHLTSEIPDALTPSLSRTTSEDHQDVRIDDAVTSSRRQESWVDYLPDTPHINFFKRTKWSTTPLGNFDAWPRSLRFYTHLLMLQPNPAAIYWGKKNPISLYNEALIPFIGKAHPVFMGSFLFDVMPELVESIGSIFHQVESLRMGIEVMEYNLPMERNNYVEECVPYSSQFSCILNMTGHGGEATHAHLSKTTWAPAVSIL